MLENYDLLAVLFLGGLLLAILIIVLAIVLELRFRQKTDSKRPIHPQETPNVYTPLSLPQSGSASTKTPSTQKIAVPENISAEAVETTTLSKTLLSGSDPGQSRGVPSGSAIAAVAQAAATERASTSGSEQAEQVDRKPMSAAPQPKTTYYSDTPSSIHWGMGGGSDYPRTERKSVQGANSTASRSPNVNQTPAESHEQERSRQLQAENEGLRTQLAQLQQRLANLYGAPKQPEKAEEMAFPAMDGLELNDDFRGALELMDSKQPCIFVTGKAGTGKSTLLKMFRERTRKSAAYLAPTGIAALNIQGQTIHSFFRLPPRTISKDDIKKVRNSELYKALDTIVIDEVSMVRADMMDNIDYFLRVNREKPEQPFGGVQVVLFGDLFQLPPVVDDDEVAKFLATNYASEFFFDAHVFRQVELKPVELRKVYRQNDPVFLELLNAVRINRVSLPQLAVLNKRFDPALSYDDAAGYLTLTPDNNLAFTVNRTQLDRIPYPEFHYMGRVEGTFDHYPAEEHLILKQGAQVMFVKNDLKKRWMNGTIGRVQALDETCINVEVRSPADGHAYVFPVDMDSWENVKYRFDYQSGSIKAEVVGSFAQFPLKLAWAVTIHKSQGLTFDRIVIDMGNGAFEDGQTYVALSRCTSLEGITLRRPLRWDDIKVNGSVERFMLQSGNLPRPVSATESEKLAKVLSSPRGQKVIGGHPFFDAISLTQALNAAREEARHTGKYKIVMYDKSGKQRSFCFYWNVHMIASNLESAGISEGSIRCEFDGHGSQHGSGGTSYTPTSSISAASPAMPSPSPVKNRIDPAPQPASQPTPQPTSTPTPQPTPQPTLKPTPQPAPVPMPSPSPAKDRIDTTKTTKSSPPDWNPPSWLLALTDEHATIEVQCVMVTLQGVERAIYPNMGRGSGKDWVWFDLSEFSDLDTWLHKRGYHVVNKENGAHHLRRGKSRFVSPALESIFADELFVHAQFFIEMWHTG